MNQIAGMNQSFANVKEESDMILASRVVDTNMRALPSQFLTSGNFAI